MKSSGDIFFVGKETEDDPPALHIFRYKEVWQKIGTKSVTCSHDAFFFLPLMIENNEHLLLSCMECSTIWFYDIHSGEFNEALKEEGFYPTLVCEAEEGLIYFVNSVKCFPCSEGKVFSY